MSHVPSKISFVVLYVRDLAKSRAFYRDTLGFPVKTDEDGYVEFETQPVPLALLSWDSASELIGEKLMGETGPPHFALSLGEVADVDAVYAGLQKMGVHFVNAPKDNPWGQRTAHFRDPDGNLLEVYTWKPSK